MSALTAALNGHDVTDEEGQVSETTDAGESVAQETNTEEEFASPEKGAETEVEEPKANTDETESELAEDESGNRYVPQKRFDKVYGRTKQLERELEELKRNAPRQTVDQPAPNQPTTSPDVETELLYVSLPQFNPESDQYNQELDRLGAQIFKANPGITKPEAARRAIKIAKSLTQDQAQVVAEARKIKSLSSDQGITNRVSQRRSEPDTSKMTLDQLEDHLKATGEWNRF